jgi:hypothetical protein
LHSGAAAELLLNDLKVELAEGERSAEVLRRSYLEAMQLDEP